VEQIQNIKHHIMVVGLMEQQQQQVIIGKWEYNGTYWICRMSYAATDAQAIAYKTSITSSNSYVSASTLGAASGSYLRVCKPSVMIN
jgi:hypothetical protein